MKHTDPNQYYNVQTYPMKMIKTSFSDDAVMGTKFLSNKAVWDDINENVWMSLYKSVYEHVRDEIAISITFKGI